MASQPTLVTRRALLGSAATGTLSLAAAPAAWALAGEDEHRLAQTEPRPAKPKAKNPICCFEKPLQWMSFEQLAETVAEAGYDGVEATVRDGGHIAPSQVGEQLPRMVDALHRRGLKIHVMASSINDANDPMSEKVLRTAAGLGIPRYRVKYYKYDLTRPILDQVHQFAAQLKQLAALNAAVGIQGVYQNHSGRDYFGAPVWDLAIGLRAVDPRHLAVAFDIRHATVEGGLCWPIHFHLIQPRLGIVYAKDFVWKDGRPANVPLGQGQVDPRFFRQLTQSGYHGPVSVHVEYYEASKAKQDPGPVIKAIQRDRQTLSRWL